MTLLLLGLLGGSFVYCTLVVIAAWRYKRQKPPVLGDTPAISVLKPLCGTDDELEDNLASFFEQDYPEYEILFAVHEPNDPALEAVRRVRQRHLQIPVRVIVTGEPPVANRKVFSLSLMLEAARHALIVTSDSDVRAPRDLLRTFAAEFRDEKLGLATCPYRVHPSGSSWASVEAAGLNSEFLAGVLVAAMLEGVKFALGPTMALRREVVERLGGFLAFKDHLAEDFVIGQRTAALGYRTILSSCVVEHRVSARGLGESLRHQLRWARSTRRSRPAGYVGQVFTNPIPLALLCWALRPDWWLVLLGAALVRGLATWATSQLVLGDPLVRRRWWLVPLQDLISFCVWLTGFVGNTVTWRGRQYRLEADGRFRPA